MPADVLSDLGKPMGCPAKPLGRPYSAALGKMYPIWCPLLFWVVRESTKYLILLVTPAGFEPATFSLEDSFCLFPIASHFHRCRF
jgi:hypothetical protein